MKIIEVPLRVFDELIASAEAWVAYMDDLNATSDQGDPLSVARNCHHGKRVERTRESVAAAKKWRALVATVKIK